MGFKKVEDGWQFDIQIGYQGKRYRKKFKTQAEGKRWEAWIRSQHAKNPEWEAAPKDKRHLSELIQKWYELHGKHLKDGEGRLRILMHTCNGLNNPKARELTGGMFTTYRSGRDVTPNTLNHELAYLKAVFNELIKLDEWKESNPLAKVKKLKADEIDLHYLSRTEIEVLLDELAKRRNPDAIRVAKICLATGARWSEAEELESKNLHQYRIDYMGTKSGKNRTIPISKTLYKEIQTGKSGRLFTGCYDAFSNALNDSGIELPKGQRTHVLRHTFAAHFIMNGGNLLTLQKILGHSTIQMTMRYAHLAPEHLQDAVVKNPLA